MSLPQWKGSSGVRAGRSDPILPRPPPQSRYAGLLDASTPGAPANSSLFYWLVEQEQPAGGEADADADDAPLILWLQGGPGASSLFSLFTETGPFRFATPAASLGSCFNASGGWNETGCTFNQFAGELWNARLHQVDPPSKPAIHP